MAVGVWRRVRALFAPGGGNTLDGSSPAPGVPRMKRLAAGLLALAALVALGVGVYGRFLRTPPPPADAPDYKDDLARPLARDPDFEELARTDPVAMYEQCLARYQREVRGGLAVTLVKKERVRGEPQPPKEPVEEEIELAVRGDIPDADGRHCVEVLMRWKSGHRTDLFGTRIDATLYSEQPGDAGTGGRVIVWRPKARLTPATVPLAPTDELARRQSRFCIRDAGIYRGMLRTYTAWKQRKEAGTLDVKYLGKQAVPQTGGRVCHVVERTCQAAEADAFELGGPPVTDPRVIEREGFVRVRTMIDAETWMQVGTELYRPDGNLLASYYFRDPNTRPAFAPGTFTRAGLTRQ